MHQDRKENKLMQWMEAAAAEEAENEEDDWDEEDQDADRTQHHSQQRRVTFNFEIFKGMVTSVSVNGKHESICRKFPPVRSLP
jgi:hypothetical protein